MTIAENTAAKTDWVEPAVTTLEIDETNTNPGAGSDGGPLPDCTSS